MITTECPICNRSDKLQLLRKDFYEFTLYRCNCNGIEFCHPLVEPNRDFYIDANDSETERRHNLKEEWRKDHPTNFSSIFIGSQGKKLLDVGCGNGAFAEFASNRGFKVIGLDVDAVSLNVAKDRDIENCKFFQNDLIGYLHEEELKFDVVTMFEVFEHLHNPKEVIQKVYQSLNNQGVFVGTLPNENRFFAKTFNLEFALPPYHLTFWTTDSWSKFLRDNGFEMISCTCNVYYGYLSGLMWTKVKSNQMLQRNPVGRFILKSIFTICGKIEACVEKILGKSSSFYFEFRKNPT